MEKTMNYYNEIDPYAAAWLRNLIAAGRIAPGVVDERSIEDVRPEELRGYTQCHFFAGIGVWSYALRRAGWSDDRPVWTGSCPCQPFSAAGKRGGATDERHLWPHWFHLISTAKPRGVPVSGEQVASKDGLAWLDLVHADLEGQGYTVRALDLCAAGVGAPHIRQRLFFVADANGRDASAERKQRGGEHGQQQEDGSAGAVVLADNAESGRRSQQERPDQQDRRPAAQSGRLRDAGRLVGDADNAGPQGRGVPGAVGERHGAGERAARAAGAAGGVVADNEAGRRSEVDPLASGRDEGDGSQGSQRSVGSDRASFWSACDWLPCIDGKARPVEPGTFPLAHGAPARVGRLRAYGNAIVAPLAEEFIRAYLG
jgi:DNA (cytosine-5)-methyltransferase 1